jgi:hypothetical protein
MAAGRHFLKLLTEEQYRSGDPSSVEELMQTIGNYSEWRIRSKIIFPLSPREAVLSYWNFPFDGKFGAMIFENLNGIPKTKGYIQAYINSKKRKR